MNETEIEELFNIWDEALGKFVFSCIREPNGPMMCAIESDLEIARSKFLEALKKRPNQTWKLNTVTYYAVDNVLQFHWTGL